MSKFDLPERKPVNKAIPVGKWTNLDHITHDFAECEAFRISCIRKYGQFMGADGKRVTLADIEGDR